MWMLLALGVASFSNLPLDDADLTQRAASSADLALRLAAPCLDMGSTYEKSRCLSREAQKAEAAAEASFRSAKARDAVDMDYSGYDPRPEMERAQRAWRAWTQADCEMQANLNRGNAGAIVQPICRIKHALQRSEELDLL